MVAKEQAELDQLVGDWAVKEGQLLAELRTDRDDAVRVTRETWSPLCSVERTAVVWSRRRSRSGKRRRKKEKEEEEEDVDLLVSDCLLGQWIHAPRQSTEPLAAQCALVFFLGVYFFYGPLYLAATCSVLVCPEEYSTWFWEMTSGYVVFSASWFDSGYIFMPVYGR